MAKKKKAIRLNPSFSSEVHFFVYYVEIDELKGATEPIEKGRYSTHMAAHNFLAGIFHNGRMEETATFENSTIIQKSPIHPNKTYKWYIEEK
jgi:hypothetical protein